MKLETFKGSGYLESTLGQILIPLMEKWENFLKG